MGPLVTTRVASCIRLMVPVEPYWVRLRRLRNARGLSQPRLYRLTDDVSLDTIRALERDPEQPTRSPRSRSRYPSAAMIERLCRALEVPPEEFPEYRLARARDRLDDRFAGLDQAVAALERIEQELLR
jgi:transcriptional regulator with XRE-family HTH domain